MAAKVPQSINQELGIHDGFRLHGIRTFQSDVKQMGWKPVSFLIVTEFNTSGSADRRLYLPSFWRSKCNLPFHLGGSGWI
jgi:hypothetical protein